MGPHSHASSNNDEETESFGGGMPSKRIIIIGGGLAGLALALALKRVGRSTGLNLDVVVFEEKTDAEYNESGGHYLLWRWAVDVLIEMGLGGKLSRIAAPILKFTSIDAETNEDLVQWPPSRAELGTSSTSVEEELGVDSALPPMVSARRCDLLRLLMIALSGRRDDLVFGDDFLPSPANNSDMSPEPMLGLEADLASGSWFETENFKYLVPELVLGECLESYTVNPATGKVTVEFESGRVEVADVLVGADGVHSKVRKILVNGKGNIPAHAGTCILSGITRLVLPPVDTPDVMENGKPIEDLHRDDVHEFCPDGRSVSVVAKSLSFGMTNLGNGMLGWNLVVAQTEPNQHVDTFNMIKTRKMVSEAIAKNPRSSIVMSTNFSLHNGAPDPALQGLGSIQTDTTNPEDKWGGGSTLSSPGGTSPSGRRMMNMYSEPEVDDETSRSSTNDDEETLTAGNDDEDDEDDADVIENLRRMAFKESEPTVTPSWDNGEGSSDSSPPGSPRRPPRRGRTTASGGHGGNIAGDPDLQRRLREKLEAEKPTNLRINHRSLPPPSPSSPMAPGAYPMPNSAITPGSGMMPNLFAPPAPLTGSEIRTLALRLAQNTNLPHPCHAVMARTDPNLTTCQDVTDLAEDPLETFSNPHQPGRVFLIGDAAHPIAPQAHGSIGAGLALTDAALLAKLLAKNLVSPSAPTSPSASPLPPVDDDDTARALAATAAEFDKERMAMATGVMKEARAEGDWSRTEHGWVRSLMRIGRRYTPSTWTKASYTTMLTRGAVRSGLPSLMPVGY